MLRSISPSSPICLKILSTMYPLQLGMHPICSPSNPGPQSLLGTFTNPPSCAGAAFLRQIKLPKVWGQHPMHHSPSKEGAEEGSVSWQLLVDRSSSVICKKHQEFLIIRPPLVDQPKPTAFYQETWTLTAANPPPSQMTIAAFTTISPNF